MEIAILDDYQRVIKKLNCFQILNGQDVTIYNHFENDIEKLARQIADFEIIVLTRERTQISEELLAKLPKLKLISQTGKISNHLSLENCTKYKVAVAEGVGSSIAPTELAWALLMNTVRRIPQAITGMKAGQWQTNIGRTIHGKTIGIWGYGKIGQRMAQYAKVFGAQVLVWGSESSQEKAVMDGFQKANSKVAFFETADIITLHLRLNAQTFGIIKESDLRRMKDNSVLINTARAALIEKNALLNTLKSGKRILVGLDVYENEPIYNIDFDFLNMENVICTPHLGYVEESGYELYFGKAFDNVIQYIKGNPTNIANPEVLTAARHFK